jgi:membrane-associated phospholipid phosphatase
VGAVARFSRLGEHGAVWFVIAAASRRWDAARTVALAYGANQVVKVVVRRRRPPPEGRHTRTLSDLSYPSAHAATSVAGARRLSETLPAAPLWALAAALAGSRLYLGVHYPSDTVAGAALGASIAELTR